MLGYFGSNLKHYWQSERQKTYTSIGLSVGLVLVFSVFALRPTALTVTDLNGKLKQGREANQKLDEKIQALGIADQNLKKIENTVYLLNEALPQNANTLDLLNKVNFLAKQKNLLVSKSQAQNVEVLSSTQNSSATDATEKTLTEKTLTFELEAKGQYENLRDFLLEMGRLNRFLSIDSVSFTKEKDSNDLKLAFKGTAYFLP